VIKLKLLIVCEAIPIVSAFITKLVLHGFSEWWKIAVMLVISAICSAVYLYDISRYSYITKEEEDG
jgi:hypothetical protein